MSRLPDLDTRCGRFLTYREFVECGETWRASNVDNVPRQLETYRALDALAAHVLDPVIATLGPIELSYCVATHNLTKLIRSRIAPTIDQHASFERSQRGELICKRGGAACDFTVVGLDSLSAAKWIAQETDFDRLYFYGKELPIHVSISGHPVQKCTVFQGSGASSVPRTYTAERFVSLASHHADGNGEEPDISTVQWL